MKVILGEETREREERGRGEAKQRKRGIERKGIDLLNREEIKGGESEIE